MVAASSDARPLCGEALSNPMPVQVKICGTTSPRDARLSHEAGADFLGVMLYHPRSPRHISLQTAREIKAAAPTAIVALSVNQTLERLLEIADVLQPHALQLHGDESPQLVEQLSARGLRVWKAVSGDQNALLSQAGAFRDAGAEAILVDARDVSPQGVIYGGTGKSADWNAARNLVESGFRVILAGGLTPENVGRAIETVQPWGVDVVSGVEAEKGVKLRERVLAFVARAKIVDRN